MARSYSMRKHRFESCPDYNITKDIEI